MTLGRVTVVAAVLVALIAMPAVCETESPYGTSSCVEYDREGELLLIRNDCPAAGEGCTREFLTLEEAIEAVKRYRWIDVSASMKRPGHAAWESELKLLSTGAEALVLIYLPQGVDELACGGTGIAWLIDAIRLYYYEDYPIDHPYFQETLSSLVDAVTGEGINILVTSKSYGAHQTLEVVHGNPRVFHLSIGPSFGAFKDTVGDVRNPHVDTYIRNLGRARCQECLVTSFNDCWGLYAFGAALSRTDERSYECDDYKNPEHPDSHPVTSRCPGEQTSCRIYGNTEVYDAIYSNSDNVKTVTVSGSGHYTPSYYDHGLLDAMRRCPDLFGMELSVAADVLAGTHPDFARRLVPVLALNLN